jgi:UDP-N-acetylmuramate dehydrogenase
MRTLENSEISQLTTLRIGGKAEKLYIPETAEELANLVRELNENEIPWGILGGGSNTLISSRGVKGAVISTASLGWINKVAPDCVVAGCGVRLPKLAGQVANMGLQGCEFLEGIPGTVGGAIVMNAGAHGQWTADILEKITILDVESGEIQVLPVGQLTFGYRRSSINCKKHVVIEAKFRLKTAMPQEIHDRMKQYSRQRSATQPKGFSSGCMFRNPATNTPAGRLIDEMGFKGMKIGAAEVSPAHANFIMNAKDASSEDICGLLKQIQTEAMNTRGLWLEPEVCPLGEFSEEEKIIWQRPVQLQTSESIVLKQAG